MIKTYSSFYYGHTITKSNAYLNFDEGNGELTAKLAIKGFTLTEFSKEIARAMNDVAAVNEYTTELDRTTRKITIKSSDGTFSLLSFSGTQAELSCFSLAGFLNASDFVGQTEYESDLSSGSAFIPFLRLQSYTKFDNSQSVASSSSSENAKGDIIEVVNYGEVKMMKCNIKMQINMEDRLKKGFLKNSSDGEDQLRFFLRYITTKAPIEFIEDIENDQNYNKCILTKTRKDTKGLGFEIYEDKEAKDFYESGPLEFREIR